MLFTWGMLKRKQISTVLILSVAILILGLGILNTFAPTIDVSAYQKDILGQISEVIKRKVSIDGKLSLKISLKPMLVTQNLVIDNPEWCKTPYFLKSEKVEVGVDVLDLLFGKITIDRLILAKAEINLELNRKDKNNWSFGQQKIPAENGKSKSLIRLDYVMLDDVKLNYLSSKDHKKLSVSHGLLRRNLRGRYRLKLESILGGQKFVVQLHSNRWIDFTDIRPLRLKLEAAFGKNKLLANIDVQQLMPALKADVKLNSSMLDLNSLHKQFPKRGNKQTSKTDVFGEVNSWLQKADYLTLDVNIEKMLYGQYVTNDLFVKSKVIHEQVGEKDKYFVAMSGAVRKIANLKDKHPLLFGVDNELDYGQLNFSLSSEGDSLSRLISDADAKIRLSNLSGRKPFPYVINSLDINVDQARRFKFNGKANYRDTPIDFSGDTGKSFLKKLHNNKIAHTKINISTGSSTAVVQLTASKLDKQIKTIQLRANGSHLNGWSSAIGIKLPLIGKYNLEGKLDLRHDGIKSKFFTFKTPASDLKGKFFYHFGKPATLNMQLKKSHLAMLDLRFKPEVEEPVPVKKPADIENNENSTPEKPVMIIPKTDLIGLLSPTIKVNFESKSSSVAFKRFTVTGLDLKTRWQDKVFATQIMAGKVGDGDLTSDIYLTVVDNEAAGKIEMHINKLDYGKLMQEMKIGDKMKGTADVSIHLVGFGRDLKEFLTHSDGIAEFVGEKGILASKYIKLWGEDIVQQILPFNWFGSEQTDLNCVVGRFDLTDGRLSSDSLLIDTEGMTIAGTGAINLKTEELAFELMPDPKNVSLISLATPVKIRGTMAKPRIEPHTLGTTWTIGSLLVGLANPAILIARFAKLGSLGENPCLAAIGKKEGEEQETSVLKMFKDAVQFIQRPLDKMPDLE